MKTAATKELSAGPQAELRVGAAGQGWWQTLISSPPLLCCYTEPSTFVYLRCSSVWLQLQAANYEEEKREASGSHPYYMQPRL